MSSNRVVNKPDMLLLRNFSAAGHGVYYGYRLSFYLEATEDV